MEHMKKGRGNLHFPEFSGKLGGQRGEAKVKRKISDFREDEL